MDPEFREQEVEVMTSLSLVSHLEVPGLRASGHTLGEEWSPPPASLKRMSVPNVWPPPHSASGWGLEWFNFKVVLARKTLDVYFSERCSLMRVRPEQYRGGQKCFHSSEPAQ